MLNHVERFLNGKPYRLDNEGIENILNQVKQEKGIEIYNQAQQSIHKELDENISMGDIEIYLVTCNML